MASLVQSVMHGSINTDDTTTNGSYVIKFVSEAYMLQNNTKKIGEVISARELFVKAQYLCSVQEKNNWYWQQQPLHQTVMVPIRTILHLRLDVFIIRYVQDIPKKI